jgi:hypothetical protein
MRQHLFKRAGSPRPGLRWLLATDDLGDVIGAYAVQAVVHLRRIEAAPGGAQAASASQTWV